MATLSKQDKASIKAAVSPNAAVELIEAAALSPAEAVAAISTADGSDAATTQALANATKAKVNAILVALKAAGLMDS